MAIAPPAAFWAYAPAPAPAYSIAAAAKFGASDCGEGEEEEAAEDVVVGGGVGKAMPGGAAMDGRPYRELYIPAFAR